MSPAIAPFVAVTQLRAMMAVPERIQVLRRLQDKRLYRSPSLDMLDLDQAIKRRAAATIASNQGRDEAK